MEHQDFVFALATTGILVLGLVTLTVIWIRGMITRYKTAKLQSQIIYFKTKTAGKLPADALTALAKTLELSRKDLRELDHPDFLITLILNRIYSESGQLKKEQLIEMLISEYAKSGRDVGEIEVFFKKLGQSNKRSSIQRFLFILKKDLSGRDYNERLKEAETLFRSPAYLDYLQNKLRDSGMSYRVMGVKI